MTQRKPFTPGKGALVALVLVAMLNCMGGAAVAPALPVISQAFPDTSESIISLIITLPPLAIAVSGLFVGTLADKFGKARTLIVSLVVFTLAGLSGFVLPSIELVLVGRFIMGVGLAGVTTASSALVSEYYDAHKRVKVYSLQNAATGIAVLTMETSGGFLALYGWHAPFLVYSIGIVLLILAALFIREAPCHTANAAQESHPAKESADRDLEPESGSSRRKSVRYVMTICLIVAFLSQALSYLVPSKMPYLVLGFGANTAVSGIFLGVFGVSNIAGALLCTPLHNRFRRATIITTSFLMLAAGCFLMGLAPGIAFVLAGALLVGVGVGILLPLLMNWIAQVSTPQNSGKHMGAYATVFNLGQFFCTLFSGTVLALCGTHQSVFITAGVIGLLCAIAVVAARVASRRS